ncbi:hypothetical protein QQ008_27815 [Fulvivirgaceae bacterium BMA10]|uniref:Porin n=1 Tax=Splendidivirga corallicola TaxID=3051826 RepID=A0ABT8KWR1_9BACT|nr:hypothetical protein [Fulvivirgaceae bacterium BMA10]
MKKSIKNYCVLAVFCLLINGAFGQKAIKLEKQQTTFFYTQLNLHAGYMNAPGSEKWDLAERGPKNQLAFQLFSRNQKLLQKGFVKLISLDSWKLRFSFAYQDQMRSDGFNHGNIQLRLLDSWVKFKTRWDRTTITIGKKTLPYGHNPKMDPVSSFMNNLISSDIGFAQDIGVFVKTPVSNGLDLEFAVTTGGTFDQPIAICEDVIMDDIVMGETCKVRLEKIEYNNTWLVSGRIGQQSFRKNELGVLAATGYIPSVFDKNEFQHIARLGFDWVYKYKERFKMVHQIAGGKNYTDSQGNFTNLAIQNNIDFFFNGKFFISAGHSFNMQNPNDPEGIKQIRSALTNSLTYAFSPHTRFRVNQYYAYTDNSDNNNWGVLFQLVTGFGKRP